MASQMTLVHFSTVQWSLLFQSMVSSSLGGAKLCQHDCDVSICRRDEMNAMVKRWWKRDTGPEQTFQCWAEEILLLMIITFFLSASLQCIECAVQHFLIYTNERSERLNRSIPVGPLIIILPLSHYCNCASMTECPLLQWLLPVTTTTTSNREDNY